jgi:hypothetical protein
MNSKRNINGPESKCDYSTRHGVFNKPFAVGAFIFIIMDNNNLKHGDARRGKKTKIHAIWGSIIQRVTNPNNPNFKYYGGRGIAVCDEWRNYIVFKQWCLDNGYNEGLEIDRINNNDNYYPNNCRFVTRRENIMNRRRKESWGISKVWNKWVVQITRYNRIYKLGGFNSYETAQEARDYFVNHFEEEKLSVRSYDNCRSREYWNLVKSHLK